MGLVVLCMVAVVLGAAVRPSADGPGTGPGSAWTGTHGTEPTSAPEPEPTVTPSTSRPSSQRVPEHTRQVWRGYFPRSVLTSRGEYRASRRWTRTCLAEAKPKLAALLRRGTPCVAALRGAMYRSPGGGVYVQMTVMRFATVRDAARVSSAISAETAPRIRAGYGFEPSHWWSASYAGTHVLIRQSFLPAAREPGSPTGPAQTYGDTLIRRFQAILLGLAAPPGETSPRKATPEE